MSDVLAELDRIIAVRMKEGEAEDSYVARLRQEGLDKILRKLSEESTETLLAARDMQDQGKEQERDKGESDTERSAALVHEVADLWFHSLVLLAYFDKDSRPVLKELQRRLHTSGLKEKALRSIID